MVKNLLLAGMLFSTLLLTNADPIVLAETTDEKITMSYLELEADSALNLRFELEAKQAVAYQQAYTAICCHTADTTEIKEEEEKKEGDNTGDQTTNDQTTDTQGGQTSGDTTTNGENTNPTSGDTTGGNRRNLVVTAGKCFGLNFYCNLKTGCKGSLQISVDLVASQVNSLDAMMWAASTSDMSSANYGTTDRDNNNKFSTRFRFNKGDAEKTNFPLINESGTLKCYATFNVPFEQAKLNKDHNLKDTSKFPLTKDVLVAVKGENLVTNDETEGLSGGSSSSQSKGGKDGTSGALDVILPFSLISFILTLMNMV